ncbi:MAG TPA: hypothetical protein VHJ55_05380 [Casimicrobiaceae bacterium]|nr:hypothetical protein [Casimicrobiaceae bacterium]HXL82557.1 hypothetical protein [Casimicrobiaceae bacterium]
MTPVAGRHTLAGVDALEVMAALNFSEADDDEALLCRLAPFLIAGLKAPLPDLIERDGENAAWLAHGRSRKCS